MFCRYIDMEVPSNNRSLILLSQRETLWLIAGSLAFSLIVFYPVLCDPGLSGWRAALPDFRHFTLIPGYGDPDLFTALRWVPYYTLTHFHQLPFWNPYKCGGMAMLGNPESAIVTPFLFSYLTLGLMPGMLLDICLHIAIGFAGGYLLGRELGLRPLACVVLAGMFPSSSWLPFHVGYGQLNFVPALYIPLILALLLAACRIRRWYPAALGGLICALTLTEGNYTFVYAAFVVALVSITLSLVRLSFRPLAAAMLVGVFALAFGALKGIPVSDVLALHPRVYGASWITWPGVFQALFSHDQNAYRPSSQPFSFGEFGGYVGIPFVVLALLGIIAGGRDVLPWIVGMIAFLLLFRGDTGPHALITYVHFLPLGKNLGFSGRWIVPLVFCVSVLAAMGAQFLCDRFRVWGVRLVAVLLAVGLVDAFVVGSPNYRYLFVSPIEQPVPQSQSFCQFWMTVRLSMTGTAQANMGYLNCEGIGYYLPRGNVRGYNEAGYRGEAYLTGAGDLTTIQWTPNRLSYEVDAPAPTSLVINQNLAPGWHLVRGPGSLYAEGSLMAVHVPAGHYRIELVYTPPHIILALPLTLLASMTLVALWLIERASSETPIDANSR